MNNTGVVENDPPNLREMENCGKCLQSERFSNFQDAWCKKYEKNVKITQVCDKFE